MEKQQLDKKYQINRFWNAYLKCTPDEKKRLLKAYFDAIGAEGYEYLLDQDEITLDDVIKIVSRQIS